MPLKMAKINVGNRIYHPVSFIYQVWKWIHMIYFNNIFPFKMPDLGCVFCTANSFKLCNQLLLLLLLLLLAFSSETLWVPSQNWQDVQHGRMIFTRSHSSNIFRQTLFIEEEIWWLGKILRCDFISSLIVLEWNKNSVSWFSNSVEFVFVIFVFF